MASVRKRGSRYQVRWRSLTGEERSRTCPTKKSAKALKGEVEDHLARGRDWFPVEEDQCPTVDEIIDKYVEVTAARLRARTHRRYAENLAIFQRFLNHQTASRVTYTDELSKALLEDFYLWLSKPENGLHGHQRSRDTARKIVEVIQLCWEWADESDRWEGFIPRPRRLKLARKKQGFAKAPTWGQLDACVDALTGWQKDVAVVLRYTGVRVSEAMNLLWSDIDFDGGRLRLRTEVSQTDLEYFIPLSPHLMSEIAGWGRREGFLIRSGRCLGPRHRQVRARDFSRAWKRAEIPHEVWKGQPTHAFRKGFKSNLLADGAHPDAVDFLQGHKMQGGSRVRYIDPYRLPLDEIVNAIPAIGAAPLRLVKQG